MATNTDYWNALASRYGQRLSMIPGEASAAASRLGSQARSGLGALGSAAQTYSALPLTAARTVGSAARSFGDALTSGENPYEPAGPPAELIQAPMPSFEDVVRGATTSAQPPPRIAPEPEPPRVVQTPGSIRYKLPGGEWSEFKSDSVAPQVGTGTIHNPEDPMRPHSYTPASSGGTVSMMTAPENAGIVNEASNDDMLRRQINERMLRMTLEDPSWRERAKSAAKVDEAVAIERGKAGVERAGQQEIMTQLDDYDQQVADSLAQKISQAQANPAFQRLSPEEQAKRIADAQSQADDAKRAFRERLGIATGNVSVAMRPGATPMGF